MGLFPPFLQSFTTAALQRLQHGVVWQLPLQGVADASSRQEPGLHHLYYSMSKNAVFFNFTAQAKEHKGKV
jgi:hypothetical protein